ncbi:MAG: sugar kinase [Frankiales bacterium]|nr:sugar kinase [Frankiales bacterium]
MTFLVVGEALVDVVTWADGRTAEHPGGSPANVAVGLARLGLPVQLRTALAPDAHGALVRGHLEASGVDVRATELPRTSVAAAQLDERGSATYVFELSWRLDDEVDPGGVTWLHVGSLGVTVLPGADAVSRLVDAHVGRAVISYDPNCRPLLMGRPADVLDRIEQQVRRSDVVKLSDEDAAWLFPGEPLEKVAARWLALGPAVVVVTRGGAGAQAWTGDAAVTVPAAEGAAVADTVGAGDAFMAGLVWALSGAELRGLGAAELTAALGRAALVARRTCERVGADPPWLAELGAGPPG